MSNHLQNLKDHTPDIADRHILDLGSGQGKFLVNCAQNNIDVVGVELNSEYIEITKRRAREVEVEIEVVKGQAEDIPFDDDYFGFINCSEVSEHVQDFDRVLREIYRVLRPTGRAYISFHNRFGIYDTHFHLWFLGWMPRSWAEKYIKFRNKSKDYEDMPDLQRLSDMHYVTYRYIKNKLEEIGFRVEDIREKKIKQYLPRLFQLPALLLYRFLRPFYFSTFHILLTK